MPGSRYVDWLIPGLIGMGIMTNGMWAVAFPIVNARLRKLLKRFMASPMKRWEYLLAQVLGRMVFLAPEATLPLAFGSLVLGLPILGSYAAIAVVVLVGALAFGAIGLLLGSRARTIEAVSGLVNAFQLPMWLLSGVFFSYANFPAWLQPVIHALPLTALNDALRAVMLDGAGTRRRVAGTGAREHVGRSVVRARAEALQMALAQSPVSGLQSPVLPRAQSLEPRALTPSAHEQYPGEQQPGTEQAQR